VIDNVSIVNNYRAQFDRVIAPIIRAGIVAEDETGGLLTCAIIPTQN
jgi:hypothetical protein